MAEELQFITLQMPVSLVEKMDEMAEQDDRSRNWIGNKIIREYFETAENQSDAA